MGSLYEDMYAYEGSNDWNTFIAVVYMTNHYLMQEQVDEELRISKTKDNWEIILVYGKGERQKK